MIFETKDMTMPFARVPDALADRVTREGAAGSGWQVWHCGGCGAVEAGVRVDMDRLACNHCVQRIREGRAILTPAELWSEALEDKANGPACAACGERCGVKPEGARQSVLCRTCVDGVTA